MNNLRFINNPNTDSCSLRGTSSELVTINAHAWHLWILCASLCAISHKISLLIMLMRLFWESSIRSASLEKEPCLPPLFLDCCSRVKTLSRCSLIVELYGDKNFNVCTKFPVFKFERVSLLCDDVEVTDLDHPEIRLYLLYASFFSLISHVSFFLLLLAHPVALN